MVEGWLIVEVGFFEVSPGNHRSDGYFCASTLDWLVGDYVCFSVHPGVAFCPMEEVKG